MSVKATRPNLTGTIQYLIEWDRQEDNVPLSVFFHDGGHGVIHGLYFGYAGSACWDDACFRMVINDEGRVQHFLECDDPADEVFLRDRADDDGTLDQTLRLDDEDRRVLAMLQTCRASWWHFIGDDGIRVKPARLRQFLAGDEPHLRSALSASLDLAMVTRISEWWSLAATLHIRT